MIIKSFQDRDSILAKQLCVQESLFFYQLGSGDALTPVIDASASGVSNPVPMLRVHWMANPKKIK